MSGSELYNKKFKLIDNNHVLIGCHRCRNTGTISAFKVIEVFAGYEKNIIKSPVIFVGGKVKSGLKCRP